MSYKVTTNAMQYNFVGNKNNNNNNNNDNSNSNNLKIVVYLI